METVRLVWTAATGSVFCIKRDPAKLLGSAVAGQLRRSTATTSIEKIPCGDRRGLLMKIAFIRILIIASPLVGIAPHCVNAQPSASPKRTSVAHRPITHVADSHMSCTSGIMRLLIRIVF